MIKFNKVIAFLVLLVFSLTSNINASYKIPNNVISNCTNKISQPLLSEDVFMIQKTDGIYLYGFNGVGALGLDPYIYPTIAKDKAVKIVLPNNEDISKYYVTNYNTFVISKSGKLFIRGYNNYSQIKDSRQKVYLDFQEVKIINNLKVKSVKFSYPKDEVSFSMLRMDIYLSNSTCSETVSYEKVYYGYSGISNLGNVMIDSSPAYFSNKGTSSKYTNTSLEYNEKGEILFGNVKSFDMSIHKNLPIIEKITEYEKNKIIYVETMLLNNGKQYQANSASFIYNSAGIPIFKYYKYYNKNGNIAREIYKKYITQKNDSSKLTFYEDVRYNKYGNVIRDTMINYGNYYYNKKLVDVYSTTFYEKHTPKEQIVSYRDSKTNKKIALIKSSYIFDVDKMKSIPLKRTTYQYFNSNKNNVKIITTNDYKNKKRIDWVYNANGSKKYKEIHNQKTKKSVKYYYNKKGRIVKKSKIKFKKYYLNVKIIKK